MRGPRTAMKSGPRSLQLEKALAQKRRPNTAKNKNKIKKKKHSITHQDNDATKLAKNSHVLGHFRENLQVQRLNLCQQKKSQNYKTLEIWQKMVE